MRCPDSTEYRIRIGRALVMLALAGAAFTFGGTAFAQRDLPPEEGGMTYELGMPPVYKGRAGFELGWHRPQNNSDFMGLFSLGVGKDLGSPVVGIAGLRLEGYLGFAGKDFNGGGRALWEIPSFNLGVGVDYSGTDNVWDGLFAFDFPVKRGGILGRATMLAIRWLPTRDQTVSVGINVPLWGRNLGKTRPPRDNVAMDKRRPQRLELDLTHSEMEQRLADLRVRAHWVTNLTQPFAEPEGADAHKAMGPITASLADHIAGTDDLFPNGHTLPEEIRVYHETLDRAFTIAAGGDPLTGQAISAQARAILLDDVLLPYNHLLGQRKTFDSVMGMVAIAQTHFASWVLSEMDLPREQGRRVFYVFQTLCDITEQNRQDLKDRWKDSRFVWLPLQFALKPEQHDSQDEIDAIIAKATQQDFTHDNRIWYVINEEFQWEMARSVREAEDYHVLWIHDFRGKNGQGKHDAIAYAHTLNYLEALTERVQAYDEVGKMPQYFIMLDQHYFEINKGRIWLRLLHEPLDYEMDLPSERADWEENLREAQNRLRQAIADSELLRVAATQYGDKWLKNLIKVNINITNPADNSFRSWHSMGIMPIPDNMMRDHRKIAFYDVTEADPYKGIAMFTGMGIGEHYVGAHWEDRAIMIQGPGALAVKDAARGLMAAQGIEPHEMPYPLRQLEKPSDYQAMIAAEHRAKTPAWMKDRGKVLQLHNETGFHDKPVNAAKGVLYSLMPPGSVLNVPDSLWQSYIYASLLSGSSLRGCRVMVIAPTKNSAPSGAPPTLARAHGLMGRLIVFSNAMDVQITDQEGLLKIGLYAPQYGVGDIAGRFRQSAETVPDWTDRVFVGNPPLVKVSLNAQAILDSLGYEVKYLEGEGPDQVKIHMKANFFASGVAWDELHARPELADVLREYIVYLARQTGGGSDGDKQPDVRDVPVRLQAAWFVLITNMVRDLTPEQLEKLVYYFTVGSTNMDYRSMVMDGEVMVLVGGMQSLFGFLDFILVPGLCEWIETTEDLDALLPPPSGFVRGLAGLMKLSL